jgi:hypothetical protein
MVLGYAGNVVSRDRGVDHRGREKAVRVAAADDLARVVDVVGNGVGGEGKIDGGVAAVAVEEAVFWAKGAVPVIACDLARGVDAEGSGVVGAEGIIDGGVAAAAVEEAMEPVGVLIIAGDLARGVDGLSNGVVGGEGIIDGGVAAAAVELSQMRGHYDQIKVIPLSFRVRTTRFWRRQRSIDPRVYLDPRRTGFDRKIRIGHAGQAAL